MKCYACKTDIRDEDSFCKKCGSPQRFTKLINQALQKDQEALAWLYKMTYNNVCLLYTSPSPRDQRGSRMPSSA